MQLDQQQLSPRVTRVSHNRCEMDDQKYTSMCQKWVCISFQTYHIVLL